MANRYVNSRTGEAAPLIACHVIWVGAGTAPRLQWEKDTDERSASYPRPPYRWSKGAGYKLYWGLGRPQTQNGHFEGEKIPLM